MKRLSPSRDDARPIPVRRRRGAAMLYVLMAVGAAGILVIANLQLGTTARKSFERNAAEVKSHYVDLAAEQVFSARAAAHDGAPDDGFTFTVGGTSVTAKPTVGTDRSTDLQVVEGGRTRSFTTVDPRGFSPFLYAIYVQSDAKAKGRVQTIHSSRPAGVFLGGKVNVDTDATIRGPLDLTKVIPTTDIGSVTGPVTTGVVGSPLASLPLFLLASESYLLPTTVNGRGATGGSVKVISSIADITVSGHFAGSYVIATSANLHLKPPITVGANCHLVLMCNGDADVTSAGNISAFLYCRGKLAGSGNNMTWDGAIAAKTLDLKADLTLRYDDFFWGDPQLVDDYFLPSNDAPAVDAAAN